MIFKPNYTLSVGALESLARIEKAKKAIGNLRLSPENLKEFQETAKIKSAHYSTVIEGNRLTLEQSTHVLKLNEYFLGRERDSRELRRCYEALGQVRIWVGEKILLKEEHIRILHALVMDNEGETITPTPYRDGQNVIKDGRTGAIVYLPPEAKDVPKLMREMIEWIHYNDDLPCPVVAAIAHYQFATIHPYFDGNGRTARLLTEIVLHLGGYGMNWLYSLEEYYVHNRGAYYEAISVGEHHNYYYGRREADISKWLEFFLEGMATSAEKVSK